MDFETRTPQPGDNCLLLGNYLVKHFDCDEFPDGTVTNCVTQTTVELATPEAAAAWLLKWGAEHGRDVSAPSLI